MEPTLLQIIANPIANDVTITLLPTVSSMTFSDISALAMCRRNSDSSTNGMSSTFVFFRK